MNDHQNSVSMRAPAGDSEKVTACLWRGIESCRKSLDAGASTPIVTRTFLTNFRLDVSHSISRRLPLTYVTGVIWYINWIESLQSQSASLIMLSLWTAGDEPIRDELANFHDQETAPKVSLLTNFTWTKARDMLRSEAMCSASLLMNDSNEWDQEWGTLVYLHDWCEGWCMYPIIHT